MFRTKVLVTGLILVWRAFDNFGYISINIVKCFFGGIEVRVNFMIFQYIEWLIVFYDFAGFNFIIYKKTFVTVF